MQAGLKPAGHLWFFWFATGALMEGRCWLERLLATAPEPTVPRARALWSLALMLLSQGDAVRAAPLVEESRELALRLGAEAEVAHTFFGRGGACLISGDYDRAQARARGMAPEAAARFGWAVSGATGYAAAQGCDRAQLRLWSTPRRIVCELRTPRGRITDPFLGFRPPGPETRPEDGLWETRQVCEFVDMRSGDGATGGWTIRMETDLVETDLVASG